MHLEENNGKWEQYREKRIRNIYQYLGHSTSIPHDVQVFSGFNLNKNKYLSAINKIMYLNDKPTHITEIIKVIENL